MNLHFLKLLNLHIAICYCNLWVLKRFVLTTQRKMYTVAGICHCKNVDKFFHTCAKQDYELICVFAKWKQCTVECYLNFDNISLKI